MSAYRPTGVVQYSAGTDSARKFSPHVNNGVILPPRFRSSRGQLPSEIQNIGNYRLIRTIGKGNFAKVKLAKHMPTGRQVAIKIIDKTQLSTSGMQKLFREVRIMKALDHPNIVKLFEVMESEKFMYLVMEYASGGEIFDYLATNGRMKERDARAKFRQIISAIHYCHQKNIIHRDLKAENLLLDQDMNIKIADFGFSNEFSFGSKLDTFCGSPPYAAPELFQGKKYTGPEVDVWSLGVILYTLSSGSLPFDGSNLKELRERVIKGKYRIPFYLSTDCESLLKKFLVVNSTKRTTLETAMKDRWLNSGFDGEELQPYIEPERKLNETRIAEMVSMGFAREQIEESISMHRFDDTYATYQLLGLRPSSLETTSPISWSTISLGRTQSVNHHGTYSTAGGRVPSHPNTVYNSSTRSRPPGPPLALPEVVPRSRDLISANLGSESSYRQRSIDNVLDRPTTAARLPHNMETPPRDGNVSALEHRPPTGNHMARRDMQMVSRVSSQRVPSRADREPDRGFSFKSTPRGERMLPVERQDNGTPVGPAEASNDVTPSHKQSSKYHPSTATSGSSTEGLDDRKTTPKPPPPSAYLTGMPEVTGVIPASTAWNSPAMKAFVSPYSSSATKPTNPNPNFTRNIQTRQTVHGGSVRDRVTPLHSKTTAAAYPEESQDTSAIGGRSSRMSFFNKLTSRFSKR